MNDLHVIEWFDTGSLPSMTPDPVMVLAGTGALGAFVDAIARSGQGGCIAIAAAFTDAAIREVLPSITTLDHGALDLVLVTSSDRDSSKATRALGRFPWRSLVIKSLRGLHSKVYTYVGCKGASACLVGSHNFTAGGARTNEEAGILFMSSTHSVVNTVAGAYLRHVCDLADSAKEYVDTARAAHCII